MTSKKIEFLKKPNNKEANQFIDNWVSGNAVPKGMEKKLKLKRTTIYLPENLHKRLKVMAANTETSMTEIIIDTLKKYVK